MEREGNTGQKGGGGYEGTEGRTESKEERGMKLRKTSFPVEFGRASYTSW